MPAGLSSGSCFLASAPPQTWAAEDYVAPTAELEIYCDPWSPLPAADRRLGQPDALPRLPAFLSGAAVPSLPHSSPPAAERWAAVDLPTYGDPEAAAPSPEAVSAAWVWDIDQPQAPDGSQEPFAAEAGFDWWSGRPGTPDPVPPAENPFVLDLGSRAVRNLAAKRARWLVSLLDVAEPKRRKRAIAFFEQLFDQFGHANSYRALSQVALDVRLDADTLVDACRFRLSFLDRPEWWGTRWGGTINAGAAKALLGWSRAVRFVQHAGGDPSPLIEDDWVEEWANLPPGEPLASRFIDYAEARLIAFRSGVWDPLRPCSRLDRTNQWKRDHGLPGASPFARTAALAGHRILSEV